MLREFGNPGVLRSESLADPKVPAGWALVELRAAALNWHDCLLRQGLYEIPIPRVLGADGAGVRRDTGEEVVILPSLHWGGDERAPGPSFEILGDYTDGTYAELVAVPEQNLFAKPREWSFTEAAALPLAGLTAQRALFARGGLRRGETVLILGAGGGVATTAVGLAAIAGAHVLVTTSSVEKLEHAKTLGAEGGALYTDGDWPQAVIDLTQGAGVDLVIDSVGSTWQDALSTLRDGGRLVSFGATGAARTELDVRRFYFGQHTILGTTMGSPRDFAALLATAGAEPRWRPAVDSVLPLERAADAHAAMEQRRHTGKLVLTVS
ncbi:MAG TPA: zinc-binding dehydrogenase [Thermoleophilaceae bacterium]|nr:zinc-binding dehydrogenase [Thermoleophilaceae bacterium]